MIVFGDKFAQTNHCRFHIFQAHVDMACPPSLVGRTVFYNTATGNYTMRGMTREVSLGRVQTHGKVSR